MKKELDQTMPDYLNKIKHLYDILASSRRSYDDLDIINTTIDRLGVEYDNFVTFLHIQDSTNFT